MTAENPENAPELDARQVDEMVRCLGVVVNNTFLYGEDHGVTAESSETCFAMLTGLLDTADELMIMRTDDELMVNNQPVEQKNPLVVSLIQRMGELEMSNLTLTRGLTREEFHTLIGILTAKHEEIQQLGGLAGILRQFNVEHVATRVVSYVAIDETAEEVIAKKDKEELEAEAAAERDAVKAFLEGADASGAGGAAMAGLEKVGPDSDAMSDIIIGVADTKQKGLGDAEGDESGGEEFAELVAGCVRRAYGQLMKSPGLKTQKAKKELSKTLTALEKQLLSRMEEVCEGVSDGDKNTIVDAIEGLVDELKIDSLASDYMKKRSAIEANEKKILRYLKAKGLEELANTDIEAKLAEAGLTKTDWQKLLIKSGISGAGKLDEDSAMAAVGHIGILLSGLDKAAKKAEAAGGPATTAEADVVEDAVRKVGQEVTNLVTTTGRKIQKLVEEVREDEQAAETIESEAREQGKGPRISRRQLLARLAEVVQELCQPLTVISTSVGMLQSGRLGEVSEQQSGMLRLADESGRKMRTLVDHLLEISGLPTTLSPDEKVQSSIYD